jgi:putative aldouronate transport system permease protein
MSMVIKRTKEDLMLDIINVSLLTIALAITLYPLILVVSSSLSDPMKVLQGDIWLLPKGFTIDAYKRVFQNSDLIMGYKNTIMYTVVGTFVNLIMTICGAYPLSRKELYGRNAIMAYLTFTMFFSGGMIPNYLLIKKLGLINNFWVMILPGAVQMWNLIIMRTFFQTSIPQELYDAASIDGCSNARSLVNVVLPLSAPVIAVTVLFYGVGHWNAFFNALIYFSERKRFPLQLILREILIQSQMKNMVDSGDETALEQQMLAESLKYAIIIFASLPVLMLYPVIQKYFVKGMMVGAIKG